MMTNHRPAPLSREGKQKSKMKKQKITKVDLLRVALGISGIATDNHTTDLIIQTYEAIKKHGGKWDLSQQIDLENKVKAKYCPNSTPSTLNH